MFLRVPGPDRLRGDGGDDLAVARPAARGSPPRPSGSSPGRRSVTMLTFISRLPTCCVEVDRRHAVRADRRRREVDHHHAARAGACARSRHARRPWSRRRRSGRRRPARAAASPSTPSAVVLSPCSRARREAVGRRDRCRPSRPARIHSLRSALYRRSVPMLPDPTIAAFTFAAAISTPLSPGAHVIRDRSVNAIRCKSLRIYIECVVPAIIGYE